MLNRHPSRALQSRRQAPYALLQPGRLPESKQAFKASLQLLEHCGQVSNGRAGLVYVSDAAISSMMARAASAGILS